MICMLTFCRRSTSGIIRASPGGRNLGRTRPNRNTTPRSYCLTTRTPAAMLTNPKAQRNPRVSCKKSMSFSFPVPASVVRGGWTHRGRALVSTSPGWCGHGRNSSATVTRGGDAPDRRVFPAGPADVRQAPPHERAATCHGSLSCECGAVQPLEARQSGAQQLDEDRRLTYFDLLGRGEQRQPIVGGHERADVGGPKPVPGLRAPCGNGTANSSNLSGAWPYHLRSASDGATTGAPLVQLSSRLADPTWPPPVHQDSDAVVVGWVVVDPSQPYVV